MTSIEKIKKEYQQVLDQLSDPELISDWKRTEKLSKKKKRLEEIVEKQKEIENVQKQIKENQDILNAKETDQELLTLTEKETTKLKERETSLEKELKILIQGKSKESRSIIVEIRAGTGGDEAALFVADLFRMYSRYAENQGWIQKTLDSKPTELGGYKEVIFELKDGDVFSKMKYEGGVHRVQRVPETEKAGRIHTSTVSVAVLPKAKSQEVKIKPDEIKIDHYKASGPGGQNVNKRMTAIRITHLPTGIIVSSQTERNQLQNKENAMAILSARLLEKKQKEEEAKLGSKRKEQIGRAKRVEKIRTYNFPQDRITDHRIKKSWGNIEEIMNGKLDKIIKALENNL